MAIILITKNLEEEINKKFKKESIKIFEHIYSLKENPKKGKEIGVVGGILIKELKHKNHRFYFLVDGYKIKILSIKELSNCVLKFVRMSDKNTQQKVINEIKDILRKIGEEHFT